MPGCPQLVPVPHETTPEVPTTISAVHSTTEQSNYASLGKSQRGIEMVNTVGLLLLWHTIEGTKETSNDYGCESYKLGGTHQPKDHTRDVVDTGEHPKYQSIGAQGNKIGPVPLSDRSEIPSCSGPNRQHYSKNIRKQTRGDKSLLPT